WSLSGPLPPTFVTPLRITAPSGIRAPVVTPGTRIGSAPCKLGRGHDFIARCRPRWDLSHDSDPVRVVRSFGLAWFLARFPNDRTTCGQSFSEEVRKRGREPSRVVTSVGSFATARVD